MSSSAVPGALRQVRLAGWAVVAVATLFLLSLAWSALLAGVLPVGLELVPWSASLWLLLIGFGVLRLKPLARWLAVATAWFVSLYAATFVLLVVGLELRGLGILFGPPEYAPLRPLWAAMWVHLLMHLLLLVVSLGLWRVLTRPAVRKLFLTRSGDLAYPAR